MPAEIRAFFERYRASFNALDDGAVAAFYAVPSGIASESGYTHWPALEPIRENMVAFCQLYREHGFVSAQFEPTAYIAQGEKFGVADLSWRIDWLEKEPSHFGTTYNLMRTSIGWRVLLCTAYSEEKLLPRART